MPPLRRKQDNHVAQSARQLQLARKYYDRWRLRLSRQSARVPLFTLEGLEISARCVRVIDGDTICIVMRHYGEWQWHIRIAGINCPELRGVTEREKTKARQVKAYVEKLVLNRIVRLRFGSAEKYGRWLAQVETEDGLDLGSHLLERHMAVPYNGEKKPAYDVEYYEGPDAGAPLPLASSEYDADIDEGAERRKLLGAARSNARPKRAKRQAKFHFE